MLSIGLSLVTLRQNRAYGQLSDQLVIELDCMPEYPGRQPHRIRPEEIVIMSKGIAHLHPRLQPKQDIHCPVIPPGPWGGVLDLKVDRD